ncbi:UNVERIFIED_CONTAM: hypothetical protein FKN15_006015 [Acipenser sinensis]
MKRKVRIYSSERTEQDGGVLLELWGEWTPLETCSNPVNAVLGQQKLKKTCEKQAAQCGTACTLSLPLN